MKKLFVVVRRKRKTNLASDTSRSVKRILKAHLRKIHGPSTYCLLDTGAGPYLIPTTLIDQISLTTSTGKKHYSDQ